ncbi:GNAT family N-acetyltransferase [Nostoc linckia FACHB-104]|nr:GNAT family N-acetyltransferase [Nostoc linckia FACHB-104]
MSTDFTIRIFNSHDHASVAKLMAQLQDYERQLHPSRAPGSVVAHKHLDYLVEITQQQNGQIYVAEFNQEIIGFIVCFVEELEEGDLHIVENERRYGYISDLYVSSKMRDKRVGASLMAMAEKHFLGLELKVVRLSLLHNNEAAEIFYHRVGYQIYELTYEKRL